MGIFSGTRPADLGASEGRLAPCRASPNCVSSQAPQSDAGHYVMPLQVDGPPEAGWAALKTVLNGMDRMVVVSESDQYLHAEATSRLMGFVDDVEFLRGAEGVIHVRSASRLGRSDFGVNRARVEAIRSRLQAALKF